MPALDNPKHEAFCQELAKGRSQVDAYAAAGYVPNESHASRLVSNGKIKARVAELQEAAAERTLVTIESLTRDLAEDRKLARELGQASAAIAANMGIAKLHGMLVDKAEIKHTVEDLRDEELDAEIAALLTAAAAEIFARDDDTAH